MENRRKRDRTYFDYLKYHAKEIWEYNKESITVVLWLLTVSCFIALAIPLAIYVSHDLAYVSITISFLILIIPVAIVWLSQKYDNYQRWKNMMDANNR